MYDESVSAHNAHPMPTIRLKADAKDAKTEKVRGNMVVIAEDDAPDADAIDANEFVLVIDFGQDVTDQRVLQGKLQMFPVTFQVLMVILQVWSWMQRVLILAPALTRLASRATVTQVAKSDSQYELVVAVGDQCDSRRHR